ncbi:MAG: 16S rRNA (guanine(966)-N(2))-methyltransferase RsmD [Bacteroidetes bacterium]|nr:16S rRNA (guanine(966)-N(2))-methyltransferase RsmD [Bacteroidota bacterium]
MRIIGGKFRGKQIHTPGNLPVRPTTDFAKEGLFNVLNNLIDFEDLEVLDLFAGTGSISYEFISRGCKEIVAVDIEHKCIKFIIQTAEKLNPGCMTALRADVFVFLKQPQGQFDLVFADPPYELERIDELPGLVFEKKLIRTEGYFVLEHSRNYDFSEVPGFYRHRKYGNVNFSLFHSP